MFRFNLDPTWSETGDRYMLKLFRDYLFHQVTEEGRPWLDMSHIVQTLNKLDSGSSDTVSYLFYDNETSLTNKLLGPSKLNILCLYN